MAILSNTQLIYQLLRRPVVEQITSWSRSTLYRNIQKNLFMPPIKLGGGRVAWLQNEVQAIIQARIVGKSEDEIKELVIQLQAMRGAH